MFAEECCALAKEYPDVTYDEVLVWTKRANRESAAPRFGRRINDRIQVNGSERNDVEEQMRLRRKTAA